ncbi:MAG: ABC transporter permease [Cyclobacteriaceae bacterium]|nr:ABC transporter permease [Cyclobacteriaceae bacterium]UYN87062.1 MAG: ABC transporter permease [Cyclobacteriaceae bacterium]
MLLNYLKLSLRLMARSPFFTLINILGLGIGLASFIVLWDFSINELRADQYHKDYERIARIGYHWRWTDAGKNWDHSRVGFSKSDIPLRVKEDFPEVEDYVRLHTQPFFGIPAGLVPNGRKITMSRVGRIQEDRIFREEHVIYADQNLFNFFSIPLVRGNPDNVLAEAGSVVLSESQAVKYFDNTDPVGELLKLNDSITLKVTGVFKDLPHNTHLTFNTVISNTPYLEVWAKALNSPTINYVKLKEGNSFEAFEAKLNGRKGDYFAAILQVLHNTDIEVFVQPLAEIIFSANLPGDEFAFRSKSLLITFATVAVVLLAMAWINYINLWIARNKKREKELATRKVNGARGTDFAFQFLTESALINLLALLLAITLLQFARIPFHHLFNIQISELGQTETGSFVVFIMVFVLSIAITGLFPAYKTRNSHPLSLFKRTAESSGGILSSSLVIVQYASAITLILWSSLVYFELNHILDKEVGFDRDHVLVVEIPAVRNHENHLEGLISRLAANPSIDKTAYGLGAPGVDYFQLNSRRAGSLMQIGFEWNGINETYLQLFNLKLVAGRNFIQDDRSDVAILSEVAVQRLGFENSADALGTRLEVLKSEELGEWLTVEIVGVVKEYRTFPFFETSVAATDLKNDFQSKGKMFTYKNKNVEFFPLEKLFIKLNPGNIQHSIAAAEADYKVMYPGTAFTWSFLEESMNNLYANEMITRNRIMLFVVLAIVIACLGFQGMIAHKVISTTKEIGIRKILGAHSGHISRLILQPSFIQLGIAIMVGMPTAWYLGDAYIQKFSERIELQWWHFALPVVMLVVIMLGTVASVVWKAAKQNPVEALKYE